MFPLKEKGLASSNKTENKGLTLTHQQPTHSALAPKMLKPTAGSNEEIMGACLRRGPSISVQDAPNTRPQKAMAKPLSKLSTFHLTAERPPIRPPS